MCLSLPLGTPLLWHRPTVVATLPDFPCCARRRNQVAPAASRAPKFFGFIRFGRTTPSARNPAESPHPLHPLQVLGLPRTDATPEDVKRAYRKAAARVHPDRNPDDPNCTAKFQEVQYAYSVLSDPQLRGVYDCYGEQGLKMYESYMSFSDSSGEGTQGLPLGDPAQLLMAACCAVSAGTGLLMALTITVFLKLQGVTDAPLALALIPLWIIDAVLLAGVYGFLVSAVRKGSPLSEAGPMGAAGLLARLVLFVAWQIMLVLRTDGVAPRLPYAAVFTPLYALEAFNVVSAATRASYEAERASGAAVLAYGEHMCNVLGASLSRASFLTLLTLKLDGPLSTASWAVVLLPMWLVLLFGMSVACGSLRKQPTNEREQMLAVASRSSIFAILFLAVLLLLANLVLNRTIVGHSRSTRRTRSRAPPAPAAPR